MADDTSDVAKARFDSIRHLNPYGEEYWSARELAPLLGYTRWERVPELIDRANAACANAGETTTDHIRGASNMVALGSSAEREVEDYFLSRFGAYLFAMNGDPANRRSPRLRRTSRCRRGAPSGGMSCARRWPSVCTCASN